MVKIVNAPIDIQALKMYALKSPSKYADKFGKLDLDNIPEEYMKTRSVQVGEKEWKDEIYFDSIQYRKDVLSGKPKTPLIGELTSAPKIVLEKKVDVEEVPDEEIEEEDEEN